MPFDSNGDLFIGTDDQGGKPWSIWECTAACLSTGTPAPVLIFQEPAGNNSSTTVGQYYTGGLGVDPWGNLFFTDSYLLNQSNNASKSTMSDLYYLPTSSGAGFGGATTGYAATPTLLQTFTNVNPSGYDDELSGVAVTSTGTVYYSLANDGIFAIPNTQTGGPTIADQYAVTNHGAQELGLDASGNIYYVGYNSGAALGEILTANNITMPIAQLDGAGVSASATIVDNAFGCNKSATIAITSSDAQFSATAGTTCSSISVSSGNGTLLAPIPSTSSYSATLSFAATKAGAQKSTLTLSDTTNGGVGTATVNGFGNATPQTITFTAPTTTTYTFATGLTITLGATGGASNNPVTFSLDSSSTGAGTVTGNTLTVTQAGSIVIDANEVGGLVSGVYYNNATQVQLTLTINKATQAITFPSQKSPVTYAPGLTIPVTVTAGASSSPLVLTVDATSTGAGTFSGTTLTVTQAGIIVIDANQAADANYSAAAQVQQSIVVTQAPQTLTFTAPAGPFYFLPNGGLTITLTATPGITGNPVVFSVDQASTGAATIKGNVLTVWTQGNLLIDANEAGNADYLAAPQVQGTIAIQGPLPTQTITFNNPGTQVVGTTVTLSATASSGFVVSFSSSTTAVCTVSGTTATFVTAGNCTIVASQPGDNATFAAAAPVSQTFIVDPVGDTPSINLSFSLSSITLEPGTVGLTTMTVGSGDAFSGTVTFACSGLPSGYTCTFNPNPVTVVANQSATATLTISPSASAAKHDSRPFLPITAMAVALCFFGFRKRNRLQLLLLIAISLVGFGMLSGCGGSSTTTTTKATSSTVTVTGTSGKVSQSATLTLTVE